MTQAVKYTHTASITLAATVMLTSLGAVGVVEARGPVVRQDGTDLIFWGLMWPSGRRCVAQ